MKFVIDTTPLRTYPHYRRVFLGHLVSFFGSQITYVALPWQLYELTHSSAQVGMLGLAQLIPLITMGLLGGAIADAFERRWVCVVAEVLLVLCNIVLLGLTLTNHITPTAIYVIGATMAGLNSLHRPAFNAMMQLLVKREDLPRISPLNSFTHTFGMIAGPAVGGILLSGVGIMWTYVIDMLTYLFATCMLISLPKLVVDGIEKRRVSVATIREGLAYAQSRKDLLGTYIVDIVSMLFAFPNSLYPLLAATVAGADKLGWYYSATAVGAFIGTLSSGWTITPRRHGRIITLAAAGWGLGIFAFGAASDHFYLSLVMLAFAGWSDMISGIFRGTMWNQTIPAEKRGRLASVEMLSYASGPLLGTSIMGLMAEQLGAGKALMLGGLAAATGCLVVGRSLSTFWHYQAEKHS